MDANELKIHVENGLSIAKIAELCKKSKSSIRHWLKKGNLKTKLKVGGQCKLNSNGERICPKCNRVLITDNNFYQSKSGKIFSYCKDCAKKDAIGRQRKLKQTLIEYKGGKCEICGYNKCIAALEFHHLIPEEKEIEISAFHSQDIEILKKEVDKCKLLCSNCHREQHHLN